MPIRKLVEDRTTPLPHNWSNFPALPENKADLAIFLSKQLLLQAPGNKTIVVSGGFREEQTVKCSNPNVNLHVLEAYHEEADTRMIVHCMHANFNSVVVLSRDTDVLVLLVAHVNEMACVKLWMKAGTSVKPKYIPVHTICETLAPSQEDLTNIIPFHAITGCDTVSHIAGHRKKTAWKKFCSNPDLLANLGKGDLHDETCKLAEKFICRIYKLPDEDICDNARVDMFGKCRLPEALPPTSNALQFHIQRAHYQAMVWRQATCNIPLLPQPETMGWSKDNGILVPILMSVSPIPEICTEVITCGCTKGCNSGKCGCKKANLPCTKSC